MPIWHVSGTDFSEVSNVSSVMEENSFKCRCDFQGFYSELVNNNDIRVGEYFERVWKC